MQEEGKKLEKLCEYFASVMDHAGNGTNLFIEETNDIVFTYSYVPAKARSVIVMIKKLAEDYPVGVTKRPLAAVCSFC